MSVQSSSAVDAYLPLAEIALKAAIELDTQPNGGSTVWLQKLADALSSEFENDIGLVPVYDHALISAGARAATKADLYSRLRQMKDRLQSAADDSGEHNTEILKEFCIALHDGLLNQGFQAHYRTVDNVRMAF